MVRKFLNNEFKGSSLIISHDRSFLKKTTNRVFWMDRGIIKVSSKDSLILRFGRMKILNKRKEN